MRSTYSREAPEAVSTGEALEHPAEKRAQTAAPIDERIRKRWSPRSFSERAVEDEQLRLLLEAARWAPSSYNEQPWRFIVARRENSEEFDRMLSCLTEKNQGWAEGAPVLILTAARTDFERTGRENRHAYHDVGLAMGSLIYQAMTMDLYVHQMAGIDPQAARELYDVPEEFDVVAAVAIGYLGDPEQLDAGRRRSETDKRSRRPLSDTVFEGTWGRTAPFVSARPTRV